MTKQEEKIIEDLKNRSQAEARITLRYIEKLQNECKDEYHKGFIDGITSTKYIIRNKIKELDDSCSIEGDIGIIYLKELLEELLEMIK